MSDDRCGTYAGAQVHRRNREKPCDPCRLASNDYMRERRKAPHVREEEKKDAAARSRALWRLAALHPGEYQNLYREERYPEATKRPARRVS